MKTLRPFVLILSVLWALQLFENVSAQTVLHSSEELEISVKSEDCVDRHNGTAKVYQILTLTNKSHAPISIRFKKDLWYDGKCISCSSSSEEYKVSVDLNSEETKSGSCTINNGLRIFDRMLNLDKVRKLSHYELQEIEIQKL